MDTTLNIKPRVRIAYDEMEAFLMLPELEMPNEKYKLADVMKEIETAAKLKFTGIINNSNIGDETKASDVLSSVSYADRVSAAAHTWPES